MLFIVLGGLKHQKTEFGCTGIPCFPKICMKPLHTIGWEGNYLRLRTEASKILGKQVELEYFVFPPTRVGKPCNSQDNELSTHSTQKSIALVVGEKISFGLKADLVTANKAYKQALKGLNCFQVIKLHPRTKFMNIHRTQKYPAPNKIKFTMPGIQLRITRSSNKQENATNNEEKVNQ